MLRIYSATHSSVPLMEMDVYEEQTEGFHLSLLRHCRRSVVLVFILAIRRDNLADASISNQSYAVNTFHTQQVSFFVCRK